MIGLHRYHIRIAAALAVLLAAPLAGKAADLTSREAWECSGGTCVQREESYLGQLRGSFEYGANVSSSEYPKRIKELEAQQYQSFDFNISGRMKIYARSHRDENWIPADWPSDIGIQSGGPGVDLYQSIDGNSWEKIDQGSTMPNGAYLRVVVIQNTWNSSSYSTFYPARWWVDMSFRRVKFDEGWGGDQPLAPGPRPDADAATHFMPQGGQGGSGDSGDNAASNCRDRECREPDQVPVLQDPQDGCGEGDLECKPVPDPVAVDDANNDGGVIPDPQTECGAGDLECIPDNGQVAVPVDSNTKPNPMDGGAIARMVQRELKRLDCYDMEIDGLWGPGSIRAMSNFNHWWGSSWPVDHASAEALEEMLGVRGPVCGVD